MSRNALCLLLAAAALPLVSTSSQAPPSPAPSPAPQAPPEPEASPAASFPTGVEQVIVDVVVTDKKNATLAGLGQQEFTVLEDGVPQTVVSFEAVSLPPTPSATPAPRPRVSTNTEPGDRTGRTFVVVFDDIHMTPFQAHRAKQAVAEFLKQGTREGDRVTLVAAGGGAWWSSRMEAGRDELVTLLRRLDGRHIPDNSPDRMSDYEAMRIHIYRDTQVEQRVSRRFSTFGVNPSAEVARSQDSGLYNEGDPLVRGKAQEVYYQASAKNRITLEVLERVLQSLAGTRGRKSMILVSEGFIYDPNLDEFKKVVQTSRRSNVAVYFLDTRGLGGLGNVYASAEFGPAIDSQDMGAAFAENLEAAEGAESIAADTGGFTVANTNDLAKGILRIVDESRNYYLLGYNPANARRDGRFRKIEVKVARKNVNVRARKGYYAALDGVQGAEKKKPGPDPVIQAALDSPFEEDKIPLRMTAYVFDETLVGKANVLLATEVDVSQFAFQEKDGRFQDSLEFLLVVAHRESGEFFRYDQKVEMNLRPETRARIARSWFPLLREFELGAGGYQAKMVVRDKNSSVVGSVIHEFEVPDLSKLRTSTLVLSDVLQPPPSPAAGASPPPPGPPKLQLLARRHFPAGADLFCQFEVYGAAKDKKTGLPSVSAGFVIRRADGTVYTQTPLSRINPTSIGKLSRIVGTSLRDASPGEYEFVLSLKDELSGTALEVKEPFTVEAARVSSR